MFIISVSFFPVGLDQLWPTAFDYPFVLLQWKPFNISFHSSKSFSLNISFFTFVIPHFLGLFALIHIMLLSNLFMIHFSMAAVKLLIFIIMALRHYTSLKMNILMCELSFMSFTVLWLFEKGLSDYHTYRNLYWAFIRGAAQQRCQVDSMALELPGGERSGSLCTSNKSNTMWAFEEASGIKRKTVLAATFCSKKGEMFDVPFPISGVGCWRDGLAEVHPAATEQSCLVV